MAEDITKLTPAETPEVIVDTLIAKMEAAVTADGTEFSYSDEDRDRLIKEVKDNTKVGKILVAIYKGVKVLKDPKKIVEKVGDIIAEHFSFTNLGAIWALKDLVAPFTRNLGKLIKDALNKG